jgi:hypothetical protein
MPENKSFGLKALLMNSDLPAPARFADYSGNVEANVGAYRGPTTMGEIMVIVSRDYNPETDKTRVGFAYTGRVVPGWYN